MSRFKKYEIILFKKGYRISDDGKAYNPDGKELKGHTRNGYPCFSFRLDSGRIIAVNFSRLQAYQKYGDRIYEDGIVVRHLNNDKLDTSSDNIAIGTERDNRMDNPAEDRRKYAINASLKANKYDKKFVDEIRQRHKEGWPYNKIREHYGLAKSTISYIINHDYKIHKISSVR